MSTEKYFPEVIGQADAKKKLSFLINGYKKSSILPHLMFIAPKGCGKTFMAEFVCKALDKPYIPINCSTIKNIRRFWNELIVPHVSGKEITIFFDEASEIPKDVTMALLTILNENKNNRTTFSYEDFTVDFDFRQISFVFATTEAQSIFHALMDRCERIDLDEYSYSELAKIVRVDCGGEGIKFGKGVLKSISSVLRGNARAAQKMSTKIKTYMTGERRKGFTQADWDTLKDNLGILPLGLSKIEYNLLHILYDRKACSLTNLQGITGMSKECLQRDIELYLQKHQLMEIGRDGRTLTTNGVEYLKEHGRNIKW